MTCLLFKYLLITSLISTVFGEDIVKSRCYAVDDYEMPRTCFDLLCRGNKLSGVYKVYPDGTDLYSIDVYCDQKTDGGGWTIFQRRMNGWVDFYRNWYSYKLGFGDVNGEHWLGNEKLVDLLGQRSNELRIDMKAVSNEEAYAKYTNFSVGDESTKYILHVSGYTGTAGDSLAWHNGQKFSTLDKDFDSAQRICAVMYHGAWWYNDCLYSNLNGKYYNGPHKSNADGVVWYFWKRSYESLKTTEMKFRALR